MNPSLLPSPMQPVAPPTKKMKAEGENDTVKKRREQLDRLKQKQQMRSSSPSRARAAPPPRGAPPVGLPLPRGGAAPPVARKLDPSFDASRAKSAPPSRPKLPPGPPPTGMAKEAPDSTTLGRSFVASRPPPLTPGTPGFAAARPPPVTPFTQMASSGPPPMATPKLPSPVVTRPVFNIGESQQPKPVTQPLQSRRNMIQTLALGADTPVPVSKSSATATTTPETSFLRLEKEAREHEKGKLEALRKVKILKEQIQKLQEKGDANDQLGKFVELSEKNGDSAALQWARDCVAATPKAFAPQAGFFSPTTPRATPIRKRAPTPHPKPKQGSETTGLDEMDLIVEAVMCTPYEFTSELATFVIRRPYGLATETDLWFNAGDMHAVEYEKTADAKKPKTIEIVALIGADKSLLALHDGNVVRHIGADAVVNEFGCVDLMDKPLGTITYIDGDACEKDYSLDEIYEGAVSARETYCTSVVSMVLGLKAKGGSQKPSSMPLPGAQPDIGMEPTQSVDMGTNTDDLPATAAPPAQGAGGTGENMPQKAAAPVINDVDDSPDILAFLLGTLASTLIWILRTVFITFPKMVTKTVTYLFIIFALAMLVSLQVEDGHDLTNMSSLVFKLKTK